MVKVQLSKARAAAEASRKQLESLQDKMLDAERSKREEEVRHAWAMPVPRVRVGDACATCSRGSMGVGNLIRCCWWKGSEKHLAMERCVACFFLTCAWPLFANIRWC